MSSHICTYLNYKWNTTVATLKYISIEQVSTIVVISGDAIIAGSKCSFFASSGRMQPISFAKITVITSEIEMTTASEKFLYISRILSPFASARITPTIIEIRNSLNITLKISRKVMSPSAIPRIISVELCEPQLPPVSISIGIKDTKIGTAANAFS